MHKRLGLMMVIVYAAVWNGWPQVRVEKDDSTIHVQIREPLGRDWNQQPVSVDIPWPSNQWTPESFQVIETGGRAIPFQLDGVELAADGTIAKGRLFFVLDLKSDASVNYEVTASDSPQRVTSAIEITEQGETVSFETGTFTVTFKNKTERFNEPRFAWQVPAVLISWTGIDRIPRGGSVLGGNEECLGYETQVLERGPLRAVFEAVYFFSEERSYRQRWTMIYGIPAVFIEETVKPAQSLVGTFAIALGKNFTPTQLFTHTHDAFHFGRREEIRYSEDGVIGTIESHAMDNSSMRWAGFYSEFPGSGDVVVTARLRGGDWSGDPLVILERVQPNPDILITSPLTLGQRRWMFSGMAKNAKADWLAVYPNLAAWPERYGLSPDTAIDDYVAYDTLNDVLPAAHVFATQYAFCPLNEILHEIYQWEEPKEKKHPILWNLPGGVDDLSKRLESNQGKARYAAVVSNTTDAVERPGRMDRATAQRLERMALSAARSKDEILAREVMEKLEYLLKRTSHDLLLFGMDNPTELDLRSRGESLSIGVRVFDLLKDMAGWDAERLGKLRSLLAFWAYRMADPDFFPDLNAGNHDESQQRRLDVWNVYRYTALAEFAAVFPEHPKAAAWKEDAYQQLQRSLQLDTHPDGTLAVSPGAASEFMQNWMRVALNHPDPRWNLFLEPGFQKVCRTLREQLTPVMTAVSCPPGLPGVGSIGWRNEGAQLMGLAAAGIAESNPSFAEELQGPFQQSDAMAPVPEVSSSVPSRPSTRLPVDLFLHAKELTPASKVELNSRILGQAGAVFRHYAGTERETYVYWKVGKDGIGYDNDEGAFSLIWHGVPLSLDAGIDAVRDAETDTLHSSSVHNVVIFGGAENVQIPTPGGVRESRGRLHLFGSRDSVSAAMADLTLAARDSQWLRALIMVDDRFLIVVDAWNAPQYDPIWLLNALVDEFHDAGNHVIQARGRYGADLQIGLAGLSSYILEQKDVPQLDFGGQRQARIRQKTGRGGIVAVLHPVKSGTDSFQVRLENDLLTIAAENEVTTVRWKGLSMMVQRCEMPSASDGIEVRTKRENQPESQSVVPWTELN